MQRITLQYSSRCEACNKRIERYVDAVKHLGRIYHTICWENRLQIALDNGQDILVLKGNC